jgi:hypothetical protein
MVSRGDPKANRAKAAEHGLTFPVVLQQQWEVSRDYAMFATPVGYLIDAAGVIATEVAVGVEAILALLAGAGMMQSPEPCRKCGKPRSECGDGNCDCQRRRARAKAV